MKRIAIITTLALTLTIPFAEPASAFKMIWGTDEKGSAQKAKEEKEKKRKASSSAENPCSKLSSKGSELESSERNIISRDYSLPFERSWNGAIEFFLNTPLTSVDKSSGVIITEWIYGNQSRKKMEITDPFSGGKRKTRHRYTVWIRDINGKTTVTVATSFQKAVAGAGWISSPPKSEITTVLLEHLDSYFSLKNR